MVLCTAQLTERTMTNPLPTSLFQRPERHQGAPVCPELPEPPACPELPEPQPLSPEAPLSPVAPSTRVFIPGPAARFPGLFT
ncbi:predicted GPI-anchored protein 58 [Oncorhynchus kisutch]|uniref:predicted GPI-anchored protein 58 n=1 Tax=Oncorhynchus kisutch TaxID=8019 RepID=UPI0012DEF002|nr:predicted GPI-anchored protein 58 [Oncorhynchus kisutch]